MCGRYSLTTPAEALRNLFGYPERPNLPPRANIAPGQDIAAVRLGGGEEAKTSKPLARHFVWLRWGLIPGWAKDPAIGNRMINARAESVADKPAFRTAFRRRRCLVPADGFIEWRAERGRKQPYRIVRRDGAPFAFAGLWEHWQPPNGEAPVESCTIVTTDANETLRPLHDRMPVILDAAAFGAWLDPASERAEVLGLLKPCPDDWLTFFPVSPRLNSPANDDPALLEPLAEGASTSAEPRLL